MKTPIPFKKLISIILLSLSTIPSALASDEILSPFLGVRSKGMGGVIITTGLYDENFFYNPARATANPHSRLTLLQITPEVSANTISNYATLTGSGDTISNAFNTTGKFNHSRIQLVLPAWYLAPIEGRKLAIALGLIASGQVNLGLTNQLSASGLALMDIGPALTISRKFLEEETLSIGFTTHLSYRASGSPELNLIKLLNKDTQLNQFGGDGVKVDFDLGATYKLLSFGGWDLNTGLAVQNVLNAQYKRNSSLNLLKDARGTVIESRRTLGVGVNLSRSDLFIFSDTSFAFEVTDINNNSSGSFYRLLHIGAETSLKIFKFRAGINQGYLCAGAGIDLRFLTIDAATYGEELALNVGKREDRRYALTLGLHI